MTSLSFVYPLQQESYATYSQFGTKTMGHTPPKNMLEGGAQTRNVYSYQSISPDLKKYIAQVLVVMYIVNMVHGITRLLVE